MPPRSYLEKQPSSLVLGLPGGRKVSVHPFEGTQDSATPPWYVTTLQVCMYGMWSGDPEAPK